MVVDSVLKWLNIRERVERYRALKAFKALTPTDLDLALDNNNPLRRSKLAMDLGDLREAERWWIEARTRHPEFSLRHADSIKILLYLKRFDEAEALMSLGLRRYPGAPLYWEGYALVAECRGQTPDAINRWAKMRKRFPEIATSYIKEAACLCSATRCSEAEALIAQAIKKFPDNLFCYIEWGRVAERMKDWLLAAERWEVVASKFDWVGAPISQAAALERLGQIGTAISLLERAKQKHPSNPELAEAIIRMGKTQQQRAAAEQSPIQGNVSGTT